MSMRKGGFTDGINKYIRTSATDRDGQKYFGIYIGIVIDDVDDQGFGRVKVMIPEFSTPNPRTGQTGTDVDSSLILASYAGQFFGSNDVSDNTKNPVSYGAWFQARKGDHVMVAFLNGDINDAVYLGSIQKPFQNHMVPGIPTDTVSGEQFPQPVRETDWTGGAPYTIADLFASNLKSSGLQNDPVRGASTSGASRESPSRVFGIKSPGDPKTNQMGHQVIMDDLPSNQLLRLRTSHGNQIALLDTGEAIYMSTALGNSWFEIREDGQVDVYSKGSVSIHAEADINLTAGRDLNVDVGRDMNVRVGGSVRNQVGGTFDSYVTGAMREYAASTYDRIIAGASKIHMQSTLDMVVDGAAKASASSLDVNISGSSKVTSVSLDVNVSGSAKITGGTLDLKGGTVTAGGGGSFNVQAGSVNLNATSSPASAGSASSPASAAQAQQPKTTSLPGVPTASEISNCQPADSFTYVCGSDGNMRVPQHEPWFPHQLTVSGTNGSVDQSAGRAVRRGSIGGSKPLNYVASDGKVYKGQAYRSDSIAETPKYVQDGTAPVGPGNGMHISQAGIDLIKQYEGYRSRTYLDVGGKPTIGYGHLLKPGESFPNGIDESTAEELLRQDLATAERAVQNGVGTHNLTQSQYDALVSFTFNVGSGNFQKSTLLKDINSDDYEDVPSEMMRWINVSGVPNAGLRNRRMAEATLFANTNS